jgi:hypothetical protein
MLAKQSPRSRLQAERLSAPIYHTRHRHPGEHYSGEATVASYGPKIPCRCDPILPKLHPTPQLCEVERVPMYPTPSLHAPTDPGPPTSPTSPGCRENVGSHIWRESLAPTLNPQADVQGTSAKDAQGTYSCDADTRAGLILGRETVVLTILMSRTYEGGG